MPQKSKISLRVPRKAQSDLAFDLDAALAQVEEEQRLRRFERLKFWRLYEKQRNFIGLSRTFREMALFGGNGTGKTETGAFAATVWLTGEYPIWWSGRKWPQNVDMWIAGPSLTALRESTQLKLFGATNQNDEAWGSGMLPLRCLGKPTHMRGAPDVIDRISIRHANGRQSVLTFKTYEQARENWQGARLDIIWFDEEPPDDLYVEGLARLTGRDGLSFMTFTPLKSVSNVVKRYTDEIAPNRSSVTISLTECPHVGAAELDVIRSRYPEREWPARIDGNPLFGGGLVFRALEPTISCDLRLADIPLHWKKLWGVDFGIGHPFAAALLVSDPDTEVSYLLHTIRMAGATVMEHCAAVGHIAGNIPVAWPHDGHQRRDTGHELIALKELYKRQGLLMLPYHAQDTKGSNALHASVYAMDEALRLGKLRVNKGCREWFEEYRQYHYDEDGHIVAKGDDALSASRYAWMMRRYGRNGPIGKLQAPWDGIPQNLRQRRAPEIAGWVY